MAGQVDLLREPVTIVESAADLKAAVASGSPHIEIRRHFDLRNGGLRHAKQNSPFLGTVADTLRAIRVSALELVPMH